MTLTLDNIPEEVGDALRRRAEAEGKSVNEVAVEAIKTAMAGHDPVRRRDLSEFAGSWISDPEVEAALRDQDA
jgi:plasmid stability protein